MNTAQHEQRRRGLGGSDAAAVLGMSRYQDPLGLWLEKTGRVPPDDVDTKATRRGRRLESLVLDEYADEQGAVLLRGEELASYGPFRHPQHPWMLANPDALVVEPHQIRLTIDAPPRFLPRLLGGVDAKTAFGAAAREWGREGTDEVPREYMIQGLHYAAVFGVPWWDLEVFLADAYRGEFRTYRIPAKPTAIAALIERERAFWKCVETDTPPTGGSAASRVTYAQQRNPRPHQPMLVSEEQSVLEIVGALAVAERELERATEAHAQAAAAVCELIGPHEGITTSLGTVTWRARGGVGKRVLKTSFSNGVPA